MDWLPVSAQTELAGKTHFLIQSPMTTEYRRQKAGATSKQRVPARLLNRRLRRSLCGWAGAAVLLVLAALPGAAVGQQPRPRGSQPVITRGVAVTVRDLANPGTLAQVTVQRLGAGRAKEKEVGTRLNLEPGDLLATDGVGRAIFEFVAQAPHEWQRFAVTGSAFFPDAEAVKLITPCSEWTCAHSGRKR